MYKVSTRLQTLLNAGEFIVSAEATPPRHFQTEGLLNCARIMAPYVDVIQLNDNLLSQARLNSMVAAHLIQQETQTETVLQFSLRHRNRIALQSDLLGYAALGLRNLIVLGGYPCPIGTDPDAKDATDIDSVSAIRAIDRLTHHGELFNGDPIDPAPDFYVGTAEIPCQSEEAMEISLSKLAAKIDAGAQYIQVQAIFDLDPMRRWMEKVRERGLHQRAHFFAAIFPFSGAKRLEFLRKIPGLFVPDHLIERIQSKDGDAESLAITCELIEGLRAIEGIKGIHMRSIGSEDWVPRIVQAAGLRGSKTEKPARSFLSSLSSLFSS